MSEYQYVAFRAIDAPVSAKNMDFMEDQSSRADITPWSFENEYHYGDFHGDADEMLRRGYDVHLHYANFGTRRIAIRFKQTPPTLQNDKSYLDDQTLYLEKDKKGPGGILFIDPENDASSIDEYHEDLAELLTRLLPLRDEIAGGDLRPLYIAALASRTSPSHDPDETLEPPIPAGIGKLTQAQMALVEFFDISDYQIDAAAELSPPLPKTADPSAGFKPWLSDQTTEQKEDWLYQVMCGNSADARGEILELYRASTGAVVWPTTKSSRTITEVFEVAEQLYDQYQQTAKKKREASVLKRRVDMAADPKPTLKLVDQLVAERSTSSYKKAAELLAELRTALAHSRQSGLPQTHALKLVNANPSLNHLKAALKRCDFATK